MFRNYLKIAIRNLWKNKLFSFINIFGLGLAIPFALLSLLQLQASFEFDNFHPDSDRVYRILTDERSQEGGVTSYASSPYLLADNLREKYACVEKATTVVREFGWELNNRLKTLRVQTIYVEPDFFNVFGFKLANGSLPVEPNSLVLTHEAAQRFFGDANPVGKVLVHPTYGAFKVTGVLKPFKRETQFRSDVMVSMASYLATHPDAKKPSSWADYQSYTFVKLHSTARPEALDAAIADVGRQSNINLVSAKKMHSFRRQALDAISPSMEELRNNPYVDAMSDIYVNFAIPVMILLLAGFNYTNLTLARSLSRGKEVGVRKVMGAFRYQLVLQFICEAILIALMALVVGVFILALMRQFIHVQWVTWEVENQTIIWIVFLGFAVFLGFSAGILPAWILSGFQAVQILKGTLTPASFGKLNFRKVLVVIQFAVTLGFVFMIGHMYNQFNYMATENENFNRKDIFNITVADSSYRLLINDIAHSKDVEKIGLTSVPFGGATAELAIKAAPDAENTSAYYYATDRNFIENMHLTLVAGQNLPVTRADSAGHFVLLNEKAVERLHLGTPLDAIGKSIFLNNATELQVVGVVKDFCHSSYQFRKEPLVFQYNPSRFQVISVKTSDKVTKGDFLKNMQTLWKKYNPYQPLVYSWYEQEMYERYYPAEDMKMMGMASGVIFVIALMGLLGMVIYSTEKRIKEIGVRKVLGASVWEVVRLLSWSFVKLLFWAAVIAIPFGYASGLFFIGVFTYHAGVNLELMASLAALICVIALGAIVYYAVKAALVNPAKSLRSE